MGIQCTHSCNDTHYSGLFRIYSLTNRSDRLEPRRRCKRSSCAWATERRLGTTHKRACSCQKQFCKTAARTSQLCHKTHKYAGPCTSASEGLCSRYVHLRASVTTQGGPRRRPRCCAPPPGCAPGGQGRAAAACPGDKELSSLQHALIQSYVHGIWRSLPAIMIATRAQDSLAAPASHSP